MKLTILSSILFVSIIIDFKSCASYRILGIFPVPLKSHSMMFEALMKGLARKGHQVDIVSTFPLKTPYPNYTDIIELPITVPKVFSNVSYESFTKLTRDLVPFITKVLGNGICENLGHPKLLKLIRSPPIDPPYDLLITEYFITNCFIAVGHHLKIPTIGVSTALLYPWLNTIIANPQNLAFMPNNLLSYNTPMNFWQRFYNTIHSAYSNFLFHYFTRDQDNIIKKYLGDDTPGVREVEKNIALVLMNSHVSVNGPRPMTSALIEVGGLHVENNNDDLSKDLKEWLDNSEKGFIYFSFGSIVAIETFPAETLEALYKSFRKIAPTKVLMKISDPKKLPSGLPTNIRTFLWAPQYTVLKHKNVKGFITHGGLMGTQEAIYCGVPMIGVPLFIDQFVNVDLYVKKRMAIKLTHQNITEESIDYALNEILYNPIYKKSARNISKQFRDRPMSALDTATWWIEYVARRGSNALISPAVDLAWWQIELLDVYALLLSITAIAIFLIIYLVRFFIKLYITMIGDEKTNTKKFE